MFCHAISTVFCVARLNSLAEAVTLLTSAQELPFPDTCRDIDSI